MQKCSMLIVGQIGRKDHACLLLSVSFLYFQRHGLALAKDHLLLIEFSFQQETERYKTWLLVLQF